MIREPKVWREEAGHSLATVARACGIEGKNPAKTYSRYETGECPAPAGVVEAVREMSRGRVTAESFHHVRLAHERRKKGAAA
jgi:predicted transcriptional regulator